MATFKPSSSDADISASDAIGGRDVHRLVFDRPPHRWVFEWSPGDEHALIAHLVLLASTGSEAALAREDVERLCEEVARTIASATSARGFLPPDPIWPGAR